MILSKSDYITTANNVFYNLREYEHSLYLQANVLDYCKCVLLREETLQDFNIDGIDVTVYQYNNSYDLYYEDYCLSIEVYEKMIVGLNINHI